MHVGRGGDDVFCRRRGVVAFSLQYCVAESAWSLHCAIHIFMIVYIFDNSTIASDMIFNDVI